MSLFFPIVCACMIVIGYFANKRMINPITVLVTPYMVIVPINNFIMVHRGFYAISDETIFFLACSLLCVFVTSVPVSVAWHAPRTSIQVTQKERQDVFQYYRMGAMRNYVCAVNVIVSARFLFIIAKHGIDFLPTAEFEGMLASGPLGHLLLTGFPLIPILVYYWLKNKKKLSYLVMSLIYVMLIFLTLVKYHVIGLMMTTFFFVVLMDKRYLKKGAIAVVVVVCGLFILNYVTNFTIRGSAADVNNNFYVNHLWNYIAGSLIYDNSLMKNTYVSAVSILTRVGRAIVPPINVFLNKLFHFRLFYGMEEEKTGGFLEMGTNGERGNVTDAFGTFFPGNGDSMELLLYICLLLFAGVLFTFVYNYNLQNKKKFPITVSIFLVFFIFFSFFSTFYVLLVCWEVMAWSIVITALFKRRIKPRAE